MDAKFDDPIKQQLYRALKASRFWFGRPKRDEFINDQAFEGAKRCDEASDAALRAAEEEYAASVAHAEMEREREEQKAETAITGCVN